MAEPATTYAGYKVGTIVAIILGGGVTAAITPGQRWRRLLAGACGGATAWVLTPVVAPVFIKLFEILYGWAGVQAGALAAENVIGITGFLVALVGIDLCRWLIDGTKKALSKLPVAWPSKRD